ncbi:dihydrofolate reductase [Ornithinimicrobium sp. Y1694]|uniref:dihydrofolate reductase n=1 Tax=Ornithinimicrobium sp. Y1694 TaxID=3418590 RepID=UPI003CF6576E
MTQPRFAVIPASYVALVREPASSPDASAGVEGGVEVLLQLRSGTTYMDGWWACGAAGHVEQGETVLEAAAREAQEELGIELDPADLRLEVVTQRTCAIPSGLEERLDLFLTARRWSGEPTIQEPDKAGELRWWPLAALPDKVVPHERAALDTIAARRHTSTEGPTPKTTATPTFHSFGFTQTLTLIAAVGRNGVIGDGEQMPWHLPEDLRFFKSTTMGGTLVMGRGTWDSIGRALPGRRTIVVTRDRYWSAPGAEVAHSLREALMIAGDGEVFIAGGGQIYAQTIEHAHRLIITEVDLEPEGATRFPDIDPALWQEIDRIAGDAPVTAWVTYERTYERTGERTDR